MDNRPLPASGPYQGFQDPNSAQGDFNAISFLVNQLIGKVGTMMPVKVLAASGTGLVAEPGTVNIQPGVNQIDGAGNPIPHGTIWNIPIARLQGGTSAIILDPVARDLGMAFIAMRDITKFLATKAVANPGSFRRYDFADSIYFGTLLGGIPLQYLQFAAGINAGTPVFATTGNLSVGTGASGSFPTPTGNIVTVLNGIIVSID